MKSYVLLCRPRFEVTLVELEDANIARATRRALEQAPSDPRCWTLLPFDDQAYHPHVERCMSDPEVEISAYLGELKKTKHGKVRVVEQDENTRYLLLKADTFEGEAQVIRQPWMSQLPPMLEHDLCEDWVEALQDNQGKALEETRSGSPQAPIGPADVVPFPRRDGDD